MRAILTHSDGVVDTIEYLGHTFELGGQADGYCYAHQRFECFDAMTPDDIVEINMAEPLVPSEWMYP